MAGKAAKVAVEHSGSLPRYNVKSEDQTLFLTFSSLDLTLFSPKCIGKPAPLVELTLVSPMNLEQK